MIVNKIKKLSVLLLTTASCLATFNISTALANTASSGPFIVDLQVPTDISFTQTDDEIFRNTNNAVIQNNGNTGIQINNIEIIGQNGWTVSDYSSDFSSEPADTKKLGLKINGIESDASGNIGLNTEDWTIGIGESKDLSVEIKIPYQSTNFDKTDIALLSYDIEIEKHTVTFSKPENGLNDTILGDTTITVADNYAAVFPDVDIAEADYKLNVWLDSEGNEYTDKTPIKNDTVLTYTKKQIPALEKTSMDTQIKSLTGGIQFVSEPYTGQVDSNVYDISNTKDGSILAVVDGQNATIYSNDKMVVKDGQSLFEGYTCTSLDLSGLDTSNVTSMNSMFRNCSQLVSINLTNFDTSKVKDMNYLFDSCSKLNDINLNSFNTSNVESMVNMFNNCTSLEEIDMSHIDTSKVKGMNDMFAYCTSLKKIDISTFDTSNVEYFNGMFEGCSSLTELNVSSFDTSNALGMVYMFSGCTSLKDLNLENFDTSKCSDKIDWIFKDCSNLEYLDISSFSKPTVSTPSTLLYNCNPKEIYVSASTLSWWKTNFKDRTFISK